MKENLSNVKVQFKFFFLYILISNLYCKDIYKENINDSIKEKQIVQEDIKIITSILEPGKVYNLNLYKLTEINIRFLKDYGDNLLVQLYPLECKIYLTDSAGKTNNIYRISNYNYDAFYSLITKNNGLKIKPLIYSSDEEKNDISCPLIINSVKILNDDKIPELTLNEKVPVLFYFNDTNTKLRAIYNHNNNENPIIVSFFIKEKARFTIECNDGEE